MHIFNNIRNYIIAAWLLALAGIFYFYFFRTDFLHTSLAQALHISPIYGYALYLLLGSIRGLTLIPSTNLILLGLLLFPPLPLFLLTISGILISSASVYYFSEFLRLDELFERKHQKRILQITAILKNHELPIIIGWSFFPFLPTDLICYVCGTLKVDFKKFILGIFVGEAITCGIYIFGGRYLLQLLRIGA